MNCNELKLAPRGPGPIFHSRNNIKKKKAKGNKERKDKFVANDYFNIEAKQPT